MTDRAERRIVWANPGDAAAVADRIASEIASPDHKSFDQKRSDQKRSGPIRIAVPGGSTPQQVLALLAERQLDWTGVTLCLTDDRKVADDHPASNYRALASALGGSGARMERLVEGAVVEPFDLVWLGMGEDGHVASLFPHMVAVVRRGPAVIATTPIPLPPEAPFERLSLNKTALKATRELILVIRGARKKAIVEQALAGSDAWPVSDFLRGDGPPVTIYWSE